MYHISMPLWQGYMFSHKQWLIQHIKRLEQEGYLHIYTPEPEVPTKPCLSYIVCYGYFYIPDHRQLGGHFLLSYNIWPASW